MKTMFASLFVAAPLTMPIAGSAFAATIVPKYLPAPVYGIGELFTGSKDDVQMNHNYALHFDYPRNKPLDVTSNNTSKYDNTIYNSSANVTASNDHLGTLSATVKTDNYIAEAEGSLYYYFALIGPPAKEVPVTISGYGSAEISSLHDFGNASAKIEINGLTGTTETFNKGEHHEFSDTIEVDPTVGGAISMFVIAGQGTYYPPLLSDTTYYAGSASATIDPMISIADPALAKLYTIEVGLSDTVFLPPSGGGGVSPVPLPRSLPLFAMACLVASAAGAIHRKTATRT